jgi:hypothetical protein
MLEKEDRITIETELDTWFGETRTGQKCAITEVSLFEALSQMENSANPEEALIGKELFEKSKTENYLEMPDGTRLCKNIKEMRDHGMMELAMQLSFDAKLQNIKNGYANPDPLSD